MPVEASIIAKKSGSKGKEATANGATLGFEAKMWEAADKLRSKGRVRGA